MPTRSLPLSRRLYFDWTKSKTCTAFAPGSATKMRPFEAVVRADGDRNTSRRGAGSLGPAMMSSVRSRTGCEGPLTSSADENARTKVRLGEAGWEEVADAVSCAAARLETIQHSRRMQLLRRMDWPTDKLTHLGLIPSEMPSRRTVRHHSGM